MQRKAPIQAPILGFQNTFTEVWVKWLSGLVDEINAGWSGSFTNGDGDTVTVVNGKITDVS